MAELRRQTGTMHAVKCLLFGKADISSPCCLRAPHELSLQPHEDVQGAGPHLYSVSHPRGVCKEVTGPEGFGLPFSHFGYILTSACGWEMNAHCPAMGRIAHRVLPNIMVLLRTPRYYNLRNQTYICCPKSLGPSRPFAAPIHASDHCSDPDLGVSSARTWEMTLPLLLLLSSTPDPPTPCESCWLGARHVAGMGNDWSKQGHRKPSCKARRN